MDIQWRASCCAFALALQEPEDGKLWLQVRSACAFSPLHTECLPICISNAFPGWLGFFSSAQALQCSQVITLRQV